MAAKHKGLIWLGVIVGVGLLLANLTVILPKYMPWVIEKKLAHITNQQPLHVCRLKPQAQANLNKLVARLYPIYPDDKKINIKVLVARDKSVNAYAQLAGLITVNTALIAKAQSADELAGVLAHEIAHVKQRHILSGILERLLIGMLSANSSSAYWGQYLLNMRFSRSEEAAADYFALLRLQRAKVSNQGLRDFFARMQKASSMPKFLSDHPSDPDRLAMVKHFKNIDDSPVLTKQEWELLKQQSVSC